jgi:hypothetical protein
MNGKKRSSIVKLDQKERYPYDNYDNLPDDIEIQ